MTAIWRYIKYIWSLPTTLVGALFLPALLFGSRGQIVDGVLEMHGGLVAWFLRHCTLLPGGASAMTLGHIVLGLDGHTLKMTRSHERVHVRQCERWGPLFIPAYVAASLAARLRKRDPYWDNAFEIQARRES